MEEEVRCTQRTNEPLSQAMFLAVRITLKIRVHLSFMTSVTSVVVL